MLVAYLIMLREGVEASLVVGIIATYLTQTGRARFLPAVWTGVILAVALCFALGAVLTLTSQEFPQRQQELFEGVVAIVAAGVLTSMVFWMRRAARSIKAALQDSVDAALRPGDRQGLALVVMAFFAVGREGLESVFFLLATVQQQMGLGVPAGAVLGLLSAVAIGFAIYGGGVRLDLRRFFRWTGVFIIFVAAGLLANGLQSFHEAGLWNGLQGIAFDLSDTLPADSVPGTLLKAILGYQESPTVGAVMLYLAYIVPTLILFLRPARRRAPTAAAGLTSFSRSRIMASMTPSFSAAVRRRSPSLAGVVCGAALMVAPGLAAESGAPVAVTITKSGCEPAAVTVPSGKTTFAIRNASSRALEWEILQGVMVVAERENILPGFVQTLTATLDGGSYQMTCGLLSNPKGMLTVADRGSAPKGPPSAMDLVGPLAAYKVYVTREVDALVKETAALTEAVKAGRLEEAKAAYAPAHRHYERIEPIAELFNDLDGSMDAREDDFDQKAADPKFLGFHRLEKGLFADSRTDGLAPVADKLAADVADLRTRLGDLTLTPKAMVGGAAELIEEVAQKKISGEEDRYSRTDLWDFKANIEGAQVIVDLLRPLVDKRDPALDQRVRENFAKVDALLSKYKAGPDGFVSYDKLTAQDRTSLKGPVTVLAEDLSSLKGTLGIE